MISVSVAPRKKNEDEFSLEFDEQPKENKKPEPVKARVIKYQLQGDFTLKSREYEVIRESKLSVTVLYGKPIPSGSLC